MRLCSHGTAAGDDHKSTISIQGQKALYAAAASTNLVDTYPLDKFLIPRRRTPRDPAPRRLRQLHRERADSGASPVDEYALPLPESTDFEEGLVRGHRCTRQACGLDGVDIGGQVDKARRGESDVLRERTLPRPERVVCASGAGQCHPRRI